MEQLVRVKETFDDGTAMVVHVRESACSGDCHKCSGCGAAKVTILLKAAAIMYMVPMLMFFVGYFVGDAVFQRGPLVGCLAFVESIALVVLYDRKIGKNDKTCYTITGFVERSFLNSGKKGDNNID